MANPEVRISGKTFATNPTEFLPLTPDDDLDVQFEDENIEQETGWRLEQNTNSYYRWRWQLKEADGRPSTYTTSSGKIGYKRGSKYVGKRKD